MKLFTLKNGYVEIDLDCLLVPELKAVYDKYEDNVMAFTYLHYLTNPASIYRDEQNPQQRVYETYNGSFHPDDIEIVNAAKFLNSFKGPLHRFWEGQKIMLDRISEYMASTPIDDSRDGNSGFILRIYDKAKNVMDSYNKAVDARNKEVEKGRGDQELPYDIQ